MRSLKSYNPQPTRKLHTSWITLDDELLRDYSADEVMYGGYNVYTTLDLNLQRAAVDAVAKGLTLVEKEIAADKKKKTADHDEPTPRPQAAMIAMDPQTGEIKAMVGGQRLQCKPIQSSDACVSSAGFRVQAFRLCGRIGNRFRRQALQ